MTVCIDDICRLIVRQLGLTDVGPDDHLIEDLGAESIDVVNIVAAVEDQYRIEIDEAEVPDLLTAASLLRRVEAGLSS